jgi:hypothetical protein
MTVPRAASAKAFFVRLLSEVERDVDEHVFLAADHAAAACLLSARGHSEAASVYARVAEIGRRH